MQVTIKAVVKKDIVKLSEKILKFAIRRRSDMGKKNLTREIQNLNYAVDAFAEKMKQRLIEKAKIGYHGWDDKEYSDIIRGKLKLETEKLLTGDYSQAVDIANLAMMLDIIYNQRGEK